MDTTKRNVAIQPATTSSSSSTQDSTPPLPKRRRVGVWVACDPCRHKKRRCDGQRPTCEPCLARGETCVYQTRRATWSETGDLTVEAIQLLNAMPRLEALRTLEALRNATSATTILATLRGDPLDKHRPSNLIVANGLMKTSAFTLELLAHHPFAYPQLLPLEIPDDEGNRSAVLMALAQPTDTGTDTAAGDSSHLETGTTSGTAPYVPRRLKTIRYTNSESSDSSPSYLPEGSFVRQPREEGGPRSSFLCDSRLNDLCIRFWTGVKISDDLAARIISLYLRTDHPLLGLFSSELFVSDLVSLRAKHCSPLLVSALMCWACQMYSTIDHEANNLINEFHHEAIVRWRVASKSDSRLTMVSAIFLSLACLGRGKDINVSDYISEASSMGVRMGLFGVEADVAHSIFDNIPSDDIEEACYTAWGVFNAITLLCVFYRQPGVILPRLSPVLPIPGSNDRVLRDSWSERFATSSREPRSRRYVIPVLPNFMGHTFLFLCKFWLIMNDIASVFYSGKAPRLQEDALLQFAEFKFRELLALGDSLPTSFRRSQHTPHHIIIFHLWFHAAILDLFRPCVVRPSCRDVPLRTFASLGGTPNTVYAASVEHLKRLIILYRINYRSSAYTMLWHTALLYVANAVLQETDRNDWMFYFLVCLYGYERLRPSFPVAEAITEGLLAMALRDDKLTASMARRIRNELRKRDLGRVSEEMNSSFALDLDLAVSEPGSASVDTLAGDLEDRLLMKELTNVFDHPFH